MVCFCKVRHFPWRERNHFFAGLSLCKLESPEKLALQSWPLNGTGSREWHYFAKLTGWLSGGLLWRSQANSTTKRQRLVPRRELKWEGWRKAQVKLGSKRRAKAGLESRGNKHWGNGQDMEHHRGSCQLHRPAAKKGYIGSELKKNQSRRRWGKKLWWSLSPRSLHTARERLQPRRAQVQIFLLLHCI